MIECEKENCNGNSEIIDCISDYGNERGKNFAKEKYKCDRCGHTWSKTHTW